MATQADRWEVRGSWCWLDSQRVAGTGTILGSAIAALLDEVRGPVLPDDVKPGYVLERGTVLPDGWRLCASGLAGRGPFSIRVAVEPIPTPATELVPWNEAAGRLDYTGYRIDLATNGAVAWRPDLFDGSLNVAIADTDGMVEVRVES